MAFPVTGGDDRRRVHVRERHTDEKWKSPFGRNRQHGACSANGNRPFCGNVTFRKGA